MKKQNNPTPEKPAEKPNRTTGDRRKAEELQQRGEDTNKPGPLGNQVRPEGDAQINREEELPSREPEEKPYIGDNPDEVREQSPKMNA